MNKKLAAVIPLIPLLALPVIVYAAVVVPNVPGQINSLVAVIQIIFTFIWQLFAVAAVIAFLIAGFLFLTAQGDPAKIKDARTAILWGVIGVIVGILAFSIPLIIQSALGL